MSQFLLRLLYHYLTHRSVLHADDVQTLLQVAHTFTINGEYHGIAIVAAHYLFNASLLSEVASNSHIMCRHRCWNITPTAEGIAFLRRCSLWSNCCAILYIVGFVDFTINPSLIGSASETIDSPSTRAYNLYSSSSTK